MCIFTFVALGTHPIIPKRQLPWELFAECQVTLFAVAPTLYRVRLPFSAKRKIFWIKRNAASLFSMVFLLPIKVMTSLAFLVPLPAGVSDSPASKEAFAKLKSRAHIVLHEHFYAGT